jgi:acyl CoA:acetate/3-ketoacid CoA transferase beta subunit
VFIILEHVTRGNHPRLVEECDLPVTARGVVKLVATNYGLLVPTGDGFLLREIAPGLTVDEIRAVTGGKLTVADDLKPIRLAG